MDAQQVIKLFHSQTVSARSAGQPNGGDIPQARARRAGVNVDGGYGQFSHRSSILSIIFICKNSIF